MKLWQKHWELDCVVEAFETKDDLLLDGHLVRADVVGSLAHAQGLARIGVLTVEEMQSARVGLLAILKSWEKGTFTLVAGDEDVHTKIENTLTQNVGDIGKKIHTGRSRNDQVVTAIRLYTKEQLHEIAKQTLDLAHAFCVFAQTHARVPMPGYTHMQRAMPGSVGMWAGAFAEGLVDALHTLKGAYDFNDQSPLGSAAGYGVPLALDREYTAKLMGFSCVQKNSLYCQNARGVVEASVVASLVTILQQLSKFASDVLLFTTKEFDMFHVEDGLTTGSSIMPQKRNVDVAELIRSKVHVLTGHYTSLVGISSGLISGYNRDLQDTKKPLFESLWTAHDTIVASHRLLLGLSPNTARLRESMSSELFATHRALALVTGGTAFRDAYREAGVDGGYASALDSDQVSEALAVSTHIGGTGNLGLGALKDALATKRSLWKHTTQKYQKAIDHVLKTDMV